LYHTIDSHRPTATTPLVTTPAPPPPTPSPPSLHAALPLSGSSRAGFCACAPTRDTTMAAASDTQNSTAPSRLGSEIRMVLRNISDRKSTRLNSSHVKMSYAVFCLKKKKG